LADGLVLDSAGLIALARLGRLRAVQDLAGRLLVPSVVLAEVTAGDRPGATAIEAALDAMILERVDAPEPLEPVGLGPGEHAAIGAARSSGLPVLLDDLEARRVAARLGVAVVGTVAILVALTRDGVIPSIDAELDQLEAIGFRLGSDVRRWAVEAAAR
jgi:predicted nucleic acid-binding protein